MNYTQTQELIFKTMAQSAKLWQKVSNDLTKITLKKTKRHNYGIFYNGVFVGFFISGDSVKPEELGFIKVENELMEH